MMKWIAVITMKPSIQIFVTPALNIRLSSHKAPDIMFLIRKLNSEKWLDCFSTILVAYCSTCASQFICMVTWAFTRQLFQKHCEMLFGELILAFVTLYYTSIRGVTFFLRNKMFLINLWKRVIGICHNCFRNLSLSSSVQWRLCSALHYTTEW